MSLILSVNDLTMHYTTRKGDVSAVDGVSFDLAKGQSLGLVGESGCGKTSIAFSLMRLLPENGIIKDGYVMIDGQDIVALDYDDLLTYRWNRIAMVFQAAMNALNPVYTVGDQIGEMFVLHEKADRKESRERAVEMLRRVQIPAPEKRIREYPHQLSGGMRQRAMIAMALSCNPEILIADEPTTALDVTIQAQILDLMLQLKEEYRTAIMMITHDLGVIAEIAQRVLVMYAGRVVEAAPTAVIFADSRHPYTRGLLASIPRLGERALHGRSRLNEIKGMVPSLYDLSPGCSFQPRCPDVMERCRGELPPLTEIDTAHFVRCWRHGRPMAKD